MSVKASKIYFNLGYFRILHSAPGLTSVDIYLNDKMITNNLNFANYTAYFPMFEEDYKISFYVTGTDDIPILSQELNIAENETLTLALIQTNTSIGLLSIADKNAAIVQGKALLRFAHLSPDTPAIDITVPAGAVVFSNLTYMQGTQYIEVNPRNYLLQARLMGSDQVILLLPINNLTSDTYFTVYILGLMNQPPELQTLLLMDGFK